MERAHDLGFITAFVDGDSLPPAVRERLTLSSRVFDIEGLMQEPSYAPMAHIFFA
jgi:hypothetical protein